MFNPGTPAKLVIISQLKMIQSVPIRTFLHQLSLNTFLTLQSEKYQFVPLPRNIMKDVDTGK
jgi:hypothetical protein